MPDLLLPPPLFLLHQRAQKRKWKCHFYQEASHFPSSRNTAPKLMDLGFPGILQIINFNTFQKKCYFMEYLYRNSPVPSLFTLKRLWSEVSYVTLVLLPVAEVAEFLGTFASIGRPYCISPILFLFPFHISIIINCCPWSQPNSGLQLSHCRIVGDFFLAFIYCTAFFYL